MFKNVNDQMIWNIDNYYITQYKKHWSGNIILTERQYVHMPLRRKDREYWVHGLKKKHLTFVKKMNSQL